MLSWSVYLAIHYDIQEAKRSCRLSPAGRCYHCGGLVVVFGVRFLARLSSRHAGGGALPIRHVRRYPFLSSQSQARECQACGPLLRGLSVVPGAVYDHSSDHLHGHERPALMDGYSTIIQAAFLMGLS
jgi:hypothetical protein